MLMVVSTCVAHLRRILERLRRLKKERKRVNKEKAQPKLREIRAETVNIKAEVCARGTMHSYSADDIETDIFPSLEAARSRRPLFGGALNVPKSTNGQSTMLYECELTC